MLNNLLPSSLAGFAIGPEAAETNLKVFLSRSLTGFAPWPDTEEANLKVVSEDLEVSPTSNSSCPRMLSAILFLLLMEFSTYPSVTVADFRFILDPPRRFKTSTDAPESASNEADVLRKQCPVYEEQSGSFKYDATF